MDFSTYIWVGGAFIVLGGLIMGNTKKVEGIKKFGQFITGLLTSVWGISVLAAGVYLVTRG